MGNILALLRDLGKIPIARDLFIKLESIGARILMLDLRIVVGILSQPRRKKLRGERTKSGAEIMTSQDGCHCEL